jgi:hypothetical protein
VPTRVPLHRRAVRAARFGPEAECLPWEVGEKPTAREFHSLHLTDKTKPLDGNRGRIRRMFSPEGQRKCNFSKSFRGAGCAARVPDAGYTAAPSAGS